MARGKKGQQSALRRSFGLEAQRNALLAEIAAEQDALDEVILEDQRLAKEAERLDAALRARDDSVADEVSRLTEEADYLGSVLAAVTDTNEHLHERWNRFSGRAMQQLGGGRKGMEKYMHVLGISKGVLTDDDTSDIAQETYIQRARGEREDVVERHTRSNVMRSVMRSAVLAIRDDAGVPEDATVHDDLPAAQREALMACEKRIETIENSNLYAVDIDVIYNAYPMPAVICDPRWLDEDEGKAVGAWIDDLSGDVTIAEAPNLTTEPTSEKTGVPAFASSLSASARARAGRGDPAGVIEAWRSELRSSARFAEAIWPYYPMTATAPLYPSPGHATALRHTYALAALGTWARRYDEEPTSVGRWGEIAVGLVAASTFWLPERQTTAFVDSEPLDEESASELHLPFAQVFVGLAEPLVLEPRRPVDLTQRELSGLTRAHSQTAGKRTDLPRGATVEDAWLAVHAATTDDNANLRSAGDLLDLFGGRIEGVLLLGDVLGRLADAFAWCVAVNGPGGDGTLTRLVVPASWAASRYKDQAMNLAAVAAWADWHSPQALPAVATGDLTRRELEDAARDGLGVHILDVRATSRRSDEPSAAGVPVRSVVPHLRRGHWRRQRHGAGRKEVKMVRIAPVLVNAHLGAARTSVYRLPVARVARNTDAVTVP